RPSTAQAVSIEHGAEVLFSADRRKIRIRTVGLALATQAVVAVVVLYIPWGEKALGAVASGVQAVIDTSSDGIEFLFGPVLPDERSVFAVQVLPDRKSI